MTLCSGVHTSEHRGARHAASPSSAARRRVGSLPDQTTSRCCTYVYTYVRLDSVSRRDYEFLPLKGFSCHYELREVIVRNAPSHMQITYTYVRLDSVSRRDYEFLLSNRFSCHYEFREVFVRKARSHMQITNNGRSWLVLTREPKRSRET